MEKFLRTKMKNFVLRNFQYVSDLHLEFRKKPVFWKTESDTLLLAGDIGNPFQEQYKYFLKYCSHKYTNVFLIAGNHEYWNPYGIHSTNDKIQEICNMYNIHFLNRNIIEMQNCSILGCTLWTHLKDINTNGDFKFIFNNGNRLTNKARNSLHTEDYNWIKSSLAKSSHSIQNKVEIQKQNKQNKQTQKETQTQTENKETQETQEKKMIFLTHHLPTLKMCDNKYKAPEFKPFLNNYYNNMDNLIMPPITDWIGGHSHSKFSTVFNSVNLRINAVGSREEFTVPVVHLKD